MRWRSTIDGVPDPSLVISVRHVHAEPIIRSPPDHKFGVVAVPVVVWAEKMPTSTNTGVAEAVTPSNSTHHSTGMMPVAATVMTSTRVRAVFAVNAV